MQIDRHPLALRDVRFPHLAFDPDVEGEPLVATIQGVAWVRLQVYVQGTPQVVRTLEGGLHSGTTTVTWDGRDQQGRLLPEGSYRLVLTATDPFGRQAVADYSDIVLLRRRVVVSLRQQRLVAYAGTRAVASTLVTTGNRRLPTPVGIFHILAVYHPFTMVSPWPPQLAGLLRAGASARCLAVRRAGAVHPRCAVAAPLWAGEQRAGGAAGAGPHGDAWLCQRAGGVRGVVGALGAGGHRGGDRALTPLSWPEKVFGLMIAPHRT